jgi:diguanylate cyclase (GGDEF)-like protein/PAS domain S-box-containing protein
MADLVLPYCEEDESGRLDSVLRYLSSQPGPEKLHAALFHILDIADKPAFLPTVHAIVGALMDARNFAVVLNDGSGRFSYDYFVDEAEVAEVRVDRGARTLTSYLLRSGEPTLATPEICEALVRRGEILASESTGGWMGAPLRDDHGVIGALVVRSYRLGQPYTEREMELLKLVARHVSGIVCRRRSVKALRESEERFRSVTETAPCAILIVQGGAIRYANDAAFAVTGHERHELVGRSFDELAHPDFRNLVGSYLEPGEDGRPCLPRFEFKILRKDGEERWIDLNTGPLTYGSRPALMAVAFDVTERKRAQQRVVTLAYHDELTGLPNRRLLQDRLTVALNGARDKRSRLGVLYLDLDHFKDVNDSLGHRAGDEMLCEVARRLRGAVPASDTVARLGGDEFVILLEDIHYVQDLTAVARGILQVMERPFRVGGREVFASTSIGISAYPDDGGDPDVLVQHADAALYRAKERGRNTWQIYTASLQEQAAERLRLETDLRHALDRGELVLHYQPVMDMGDGRVHGVEALLRWQHPQRGLLTPSAFLAHVETSRNLAAIGDWILRTACEQASRWAATGTPVTMAVNITARQFREPGFVSLVQGILAQTGLPPHLLELEITETQAMEHADETLRTLAELNALGLRLAIDDFGTGYSSLSYLKRFPIHTLKLDRSLLENVATGDDDAAIVTAIVQLAHTLRLHVIAEGVETQEQLDLLTEKGCDRVQGFIYSKPLEAGPCRAYLERTGTVVAPEHAARVVPLRRISAV